MIKINSVIFLIILYGSVTTILAKIVVHDKIIRDRYFIQLASFKKEYNVQKSIKRLSKYDIYIQKYKDFNRIYVVNVSNKSELSKIKKLYPNAFFTKAPDFDTLKKPIQNENYQQIGLFEILSDDKIYKDKIVNESPNEDIMNSDTILKTRKLFL